MAYFTPVVAVLAILVVLVIGFVIRYRKALVERLTQAFDATSQHDFRHHNHVRHAGWV